MPTRSDIIRARRKAVGGKRDRCRRGKSCSAACINRNKHCLVDAPTPVEGALSRAVKAIQTRREKLGLKEQKQVAQRRREYVKGKVREGAERTLAEMKSKLEAHAANGSKGSYDKLEKQYIKLAGQLNKTGSGDAYEKGSIWRSKGYTRAAKRNSKLLNVYDSLMTKAEEAAKSGNKREYLKYEGALLKISKKIQSDSSLSLQRDTPPKGQIWKNSRVSLAIKDLKERMDSALASGDLNKYEKIEEKFLKVKRAFERTAGYAGLRTLNDIAGRSTAQIKFEGETLEVYVDSLKRDVFSAAKLKNRREYNRLEENLLKLDPEEKKGRIWRKKVEDRVKLYAAGLKDKMMEAALTKRRKDYEKLEKVLLRIDPEAKKGGIWRSARFMSYLPTLKGLLREAAAEGDVKKYNKLERALFRLNRDNPSDNVKGQVWKQERIGGVINKLSGEMEKAARDGDRDKYDKLEARFFRIKDKVGASAIRDADLRYMSKGDLWREVERSRPLMELRDMLDEGKRKGVEDIKVRGDQDSFSVISRVLGNKVEVMVSPNDSTSFMVNDSYTASNKLSKREEFAVTREVMRQYDEIVKRMEDGTVFYVTAAEGDGRKEMREGAYVRFGFSDPDYNGQMYGMVRNGKMTPIDEDDFRMAKAGAYDDEDWED